MRKKIKNNIIEILKTLAKAQDHAELLAGRNQFAQAADLLAQCQACAVEAGEAIERSEGEGTEAVACLETYCEQLYQMSQTTDRRAMGALRRHMETTLKETKRKIEKLPQDPMKVAFMPYKASMWDCMESVWEAAAADPDCETYVVPIPFYEKNPEGGIAKECYEGALFPKYVPITHYKDFPLEREQPDVIYIHNPYDNCNYVTSVYPEYYAPNLKKYTDILVYISYYFNGNGPLPEFHRDLPAYHYADKIILQDQEKVDSLVESIPREKTAALGSPKVDRLLKLEKRRQAIIDEELPKEWREKIAGKKVILFNISVTGILENSKWAMDKIRYVLSRFKGRDDVVLWWRPHPLIEGTLKSMRPELYGEYMGIKKKYVKEGWGILDETGDAGVAAVVADAYLGENSSSMVHYFGVLGKAVMFIAWQLTDERTEEERRKLKFCDFYCEGNKMYFVPRNAGMEHYLCVLDLEKNNLKIDVDMPGQRTGSLTQSQYLSIDKYEDDIILTPYLAEDIYVYNRRNKRARKYVLNTICEGGKFDRTIRYKNSLFLKPQCYPAIVKIDLETFNITEYGDCIRPFLAENNDRKPYFVGDIAIKGSSLYMAAFREDQILIFNMENGQYEIKSVGDYEFGFWSVSFDGKNFWLAADGKNYIVKWDEESGESWRYEYPVDTARDYTLNACMVNMDDHLLIYQRNHQTIFKMDKTTGQIEKVAIHRSKDGCRDNQKSGYVIARLFHEKEVISLNDSDNSICFSDLEGNEKRRILCRIDRKKWRI